MTKPPVVRLQFSNRRSDWRETEDLSIFVNEQLIATGQYGGEPEDNTRMRDYTWIEYAIEGVAIALGANVEITENYEDQDEDH